MTSLTASLMGNLAMKWVSLSIPKGAILLFEFHVSICSLLSYFTRVMSRRSLCAMWRDFLIKSRIINYDRTWCGTAVAILSTHIVRHRSVWTEQGAGVELMFASWLMMLHHRSIPPLSLTLTHTLLLSLPPVLNLSLSCPTIRSRCIWERARVLFCVRVIWYQSE